MRQNGAPCACPTPDAAWRPKPWARVDGRSCTAAYHPTRSSLHSLSVAPSGDCARCSAPRGRAQLALLDKTVS